MRAALFGAAWAVMAVATAGLALTGAALGQARRDHDTGGDFAAWTVELFGPAALLAEVEGGP